MILPAHDELPPWNIGVPASGLVPPVKVIMPQQNCEAVQSSGPSQARTAPPEQLPPEAMHVELGMPVAPLTVTQHSIPMPQVIEPAGPRGG